MVKFSTRILFTPEAHLYAGEKKYHSEEWTGKSFV